MKILKALSVVFLAAAPVLWLRALWTIGPDAEKYGYTGLLLFGVGAVLTAAWAMP